MEIKNMSFKVGQTLTVVGIPKTNASSFSVNIGLNKENLMLHINPRFDLEGNQKIVCNSYQGGKWSEEQHHSCFPFCKGEEFKITAKFTSSGFSVIFWSESALTTRAVVSAVLCSNRLGAEKYSFFSFTGDVRIVSVEIK
ncbi:beta-galactoside-binding lectin-like [Austrofundulus limnaeus]|uniref:Galectin n=1 Tax=Austrofundulus limnaeus TaxID=52670 RepID=A0A2I4C8L5_AUSLI|nr:PREDICTED: beta-galactoside-binding lectin-like [Austrofundulus limnaeus]